MVRSPLGWDEESSFGISASKAFETLAGDCTASIEWDAAAVEDVTVSPPSGTSDVTVTVDVDRTSARFVAYTGSAPVCGAWLEVDTHVHLETKDGSFSEDAEVTAGYGEGGLTLAPLLFSKRLNELGGKLSIQAKNPGNSVQLDFEVHPPGNHCSGSIEITTPMGNLGGATRAFADWSNTGCPVGQNPLVLDTQGTDASETLATRFARVWNHATYQADWDDGTTTDVTVNLDEVAQSGCTGQATDQDAIFAARVTYQTSDGRVKSHSVPADIRVNDYMGASPSLALSTNEHFGCAAATSTLPYTPADCGRLGSILIQLDLDYTELAGPASSARMTVYEYGKQADGNLDSANEAHGFTAFQTCIGKVCEP